MNMVDISEKRIVKRTATARGSIMLTERSLDAIRQGSVKKGDVLQTARVAGMLAVKNVPLTIPHCHPLPVEGIEIDLSVGEKEIICTCRVTARYRTGVEMEALAGVATSLLVIWDNVKYLEKDSEGQYPFTAISDIRVLRKTKEDPQ